MKCGYRRQNVPSQQICPIIKFKYRISYAILKSGSKINKFWFLKRDKKKRRRLGIINKIMKFSNGSYAKEQY